ncbi:RING finger protein 222 [Rhinophrynus dorsalis]
MSNENTDKESPGYECPVCYERLQNPSVSERRLSCGHSFCHDCLVKYLMTAKNEGTIKKNIICPLCRYVTFLSKRGLILPPKSGELQQILEVPISQSCQCHSENAQDPSTLVIPIPDMIAPNGQQDLPRCTCQGNTNTEGMVHTCGTQIFVISDQGQPMDSEETVATQTHHVDARVSCCRSPALILILLMIFLVAVLAAVLPWVLLVKKT